jgi:hypothetical protein
MTERKKPPPKTKPAGGRRAKNKSNAKDTAKHIPTGYGAQPDPRPEKRGRGKAKKSLVLIEAVSEILEEIAPTSVRSVCYQLFTRGLIPSMELKYTSMVSKQLVWAREEGVIPWAHIVDETREAERIASWNDPEGLIKAAVRQYRKNYWANQPEWIEVWSEKGTVRGTLAPVLEEYGITFRVMHGYGSATMLHDIAVETARSDKRLTVLYVGDWDPSGLNMSEVDLPRRTVRYEGEADIVRVALNARDVGPKGNLPNFPLQTKSLDPRYKWFRERYGDRCWELDALSPVILRERVEREIVKRIDLDVWNHTREIEAAETESLQSILGTWKSISRPGDKYSPGGEE